MFGRSSDEAWLNSTGFVITVIASKHKNASNVFVVFGDVGSRHVAETIFHISHVAANSADKINNLYDRICLIT